MTNPVSTSILAYKNMAWFGIQSRKIKTCFTEPINRFLKIKLAPMLQNINSSCFFL